MDEIYVRKVGDQWAGFVADKMVTKPACKTCILNLLRKITAKSRRYKEIVVINEDGSENVYKTGVGDGRTSQETGS